MSAGKRSKKKKYVFDRYRKNRPIDIVNLLYLIIIASVYPLYMDDKYFNITKTKADFFIYSTLIYIVLALMAHIIEYMLMSYYTNGERFTIYRDSKLPATPDLWMIFFLVANFMAWIMSENKMKSWTGESGRYFGFAMVLMISFMFILLARECFVHSTLLVFAFVAAFVSFVIAICQHVGMDVFRLRETIKSDQKEMFISTFGNINTFASYICLILPVFLALFIFSEKVWIRVLSGVGGLAASMSIITAKSDNVYLGIGAAVILLFYIAVRNRHIGRYVASLLITVSGLFIMVLINEQFQGSTAHLNGIAKIIGSKQVMGGLAILLTVINIILFLLKKTNPEFYYKIQNKQLMIFVSVSLVLLLVLGIILGVRTGSEVFVFDDKWGTYRGYIWKRSFRLFLDAPLLNKIFGYGNETISHLMHENYYNEMLEITNRMYDNCHNEFLQYLVTTGIFGFVSYIGLVVSSFVYMIKRAGNSPFVIACLVGCVAYVAQGIVNLNQPITTPFYFVMLAAGIGAIRYRAQGYGREKKKN